MLRSLVSRSLFLSLKRRLLLDLNMSDIAIRVEGLGKQYRIGGPQARYRTIRESLTEAVQAPFRRLSSVVRGQSSAVADETIWALKDVSIDVQRGEVVGIIGRNGAGKTTLLKILSRITEPTEGRAELHGRVGSLLEVGTGFHPELTGRENITLNGAILGMKRAEIDEKFDEIVAFAEMERFIDTPVKHYSSGMYVRLAFAVAAHLEPEILVVDEVLAVGDAEFQKKCLGKMKDVSGQGRTVLFVSHNMTAIQTLCTDAIWLESGRIVGQGDVAEQIEFYLNSHRRKACIDSRMPIQLGPNLCLHKFEFYPNPIESGSALGFVIEFWAPRPTRIDALAVLIYSSLGMRVAILDLRRPEVSYELDGSNSIVVHGTVASLPLVEGEYHIGLYIVCGETMKDFLDLFDLVVHDSAVREGIVPYSPSVRGVLNLNVSYLE